MIFAATLAAPVEVTTDTIEAARGRAHHSLIEFYSSTCAPCKQLKPHLHAVIDQLTAAHDNVNALRVEGTGFAAKTEEKALQVKSDSRPAAHW